MVPAGVRAGALEDAYRADPEYQAAARAAAAARDSAARVKADPEATPWEQTIARERVEEAEAALQAADVNAHARVFDAYAEVLLARPQLALARARLAQAEVEERAAEIRYASGAAQKQEMEQATADLAASRTAAREAEDALAFALRRLKSLADEPARPLPAPPAVAPDRLTIDGLSGMVSARVRVHEAERALALAQGPDTAPADRAGLERALQAARDQERTTEKTLGDALAAAVARAKAARDVLPLAGTAREAAAAARDAVQKQVETGTAARLELLKAEAGLAEADLSQQKAFVELWRAYYTLLQPGGWR